MKHFFDSIFGHANTEIKDRLYFVETSLIKHKEEDKTGVITNIELEDNNKFNEIHLTANPRIVNIKRGANKVIQDLELSYDNPGAIRHILQDIIDRKKTISILHIDTYNHAFLYGEHTGLTITELTNETIMLEGEEADIFYKVSDELAQKLIK